jgi:hypothetical protein
METLTHWKKLANPDYIGAYTLMDGNDGKEMDITIEKVEVRPVKGVGGKVDNLTVADIKGQKPFILNATNKKAIAKALGTPYIEQWIGKTVTIFVATIKDRDTGDMIPCLRVRDKAPVQNLPELNPDNPVWDKAKESISNGSAKIEAIRKKYFITTENEALLCANLK